MKTNNKVFFKITIILFALAIVQNKAYLGAPPGVGYSETINKATKVETNKTTSGILLGLGSYSPRLQVLNDDLRYYGIATIKSGSIYTIGYRSSINDMVFSYWEGSTSGASFKESVAFYIFHFGVSVWDIAKLFPQSFSDLFKLNLNFLVRNVFATLKDEYSNGNYTSYIALTMDLGGGLNFEYFPIRENKMLSISLGVEYIPLSLPLISFEVWDSNISGVSVGDKYKSHNGEDITADTTGIIYKFSICLYF